MKVALYLVDGEHPFMERRQNGDQHIGVMLDLVQVEVILVIVVGGLVVAGFLNTKYRYGITSFRRSGKVLVFGEKTASIPPGYPGGGNL